MAAHGAFHAALARPPAARSSSGSAASSTTLSELYRYWSGTLPHHPARAHVADEHKAIFDAALARDADLAVDLMTQHLEATARHLEAVAPSTTRRPTPWLADPATAEMGHLQ